MSRRARIVLLVLCSFLLAAPVLSEQALAQESHALVVSQATLGALESRAWEYRAGGESVSVQLTLPTENGPLDVLVHPFEIRKPGYRSEITDDKGVRQSKAQVHVFDGSSGSKRWGDFVRLTLVREESGALTLYGFYREDGEMYSINPSAKSGGAVDVKHLSEAEVTALLARCGVTGHSVDPGGAAGEPATSALRQADIATEADFEYFTAKGSTNDANGYILSVVSAVSAIYELRLGVRLHVSYQHVWGTSADPYTSSVPGTLLTQFVTVWNRDVAPSESYDVAHLWTGRELDGDVIGVAYLRALCGSLRYGLSQNLSGAAEDVPLTAHELGHNFGAEHDTCDADETFIMCPYLIRGATVFSNASLSSIAAHLAEASCVPSSDPPVLAPIGSKSVAELATLTINLSATDPNGDTITFSASPLATGMTLTGSTLTYTPAGNVVKDGATSTQVFVTITATDSTGDADTETVAITVTSNNVAPTFPNPGSVTGAEGTLLSYQLQGVDSDEDALTYSAVSSLPPGALLTSTGLFRWRPAGDQAGTQSITFRTTDGYGASATRAIQFVISDTPGVQALPVRHALPDFDGDGLADLALFRYRTGEWFLASMFPGAGETFRSTQWGLPGDIPVPGDYDGDRRTDFAVFRPSTQSWFIVYSGTGVQGGASFGLGGDLPAPGDFDGDGRWDPGVYRPSQSSYFYLRSTDGVTATVPNVGGTGDVPVPCDYDGDGKFDIAVFRPTTGVWTVINSSNSAIVTTALGQLGDLPVPADYEGDSACERTVFRPSEGNWYIGGNAPIQWGLGEDVPVPADYNGDGKADLEVFRPSFANWYFRFADGSGAVQQLGLYYDIVAKFESLAYAYRAVAPTGANALSADARFAFIYERSRQLLTRVAGSGNSSATVSAGAGSVILQGDYDGDGTIDAASVGGGLFIIYQSFGGVRAQFWGAATDTPVAGDFDGDGKTDIAVFRPDAGGGFSAWYVIRSSDGGVSTYNWGISGDLAVPADFDGDGFTDPTVWRPGSGYWFVMSGRSAQQIQAVQWGLPGDTPRTADFDGDARADRVIYREATGSWFVLPSAGGAATATQWGLPGDIGIPGRFFSSAAVDFAVYRAREGRIYVRSQAGASATLGTGLSASAQAVGFMPGVSLR